MAVRDHRSQGYPLPVYFLDTDFDNNHPDDRKLTWHLYGGDQLYRLCQEMVLGGGGRLRMLRDLGYKNIETFHMNEGHAGFLTLELMREQGYYDLEKIRDQVIFTTHTPVPAGHDFFRFDLVDKVISQEALSNLKRMLPNADGVSMTELGIRFIRYVNAVSKKHAEVSRNMFNMPEIDWVTNGVIPDVGQQRHEAALHAHIPGWERDPGRLVQAVKIHPRISGPHTSIQDAPHGGRHGGRRPPARPDVLTIGFARRAAQYKRADLLLSNIRRLMEVGAGKFHSFSPAGPPKGRRRKVRPPETAHRVPEGGRNDPHRLPGELRHGQGGPHQPREWTVLNTPLRPREASEQAA